jgi:hypothetical protein
MSTHAEKVTAIDAAIDSLISGEYEEISMDGRQYRVFDLDKLRKLRDYYSGLAARAAGKTGFKQNGFKAASSRGTTV